MTTAMKTAIGIFLSALLFVGMLAHNGQAASITVLVIKGGAVGSFCNSAKHVMEVIEKRDTGGVVGSNKLLDEYIAKGDCFIMPPGYRIAFNANKLVKEYPRYGVFVLAGTTDDDETIFAAVTQTWIDQFSGPAKET